MYICIVSNEHRLIECGNLYQQCVFVIYLKLGQRVLINYKYLSSHEDLEKLFKKSEKLKKNYFFYNLSLFFKSHLILSYFILFYLFKSLLNLIHLLFLFIFL